MKTSTTTRSRTSLAVPVVACTTGMKTPSTSAVSTIVISAARLGAALRLSARNASFRKKPILIAPLEVLAVQRPADLLFAVAVAVLLGEATRLRDDLAAIDQRLR